MPTKTEAGEVIVTELTESAARILSEAVGLSLMVLMISGAPRDVAKAAVLDSIKKALDTIA